MVSSEWLESGGGKSLLQEETKRVRRALESVFGDQFLQIGGWGAQRFSRHARTRRSAIIDERAGPEVDIVTAPDCMGIASDSVDVALLPHVLETHDDPHGVLREVDRVLRSDGHVIILGFNPVSFLGLRHLVSRRRFPPGIRRLIPEHRLRDWLRLLNFAVDNSSFQHFQPPLLRRKRIDSATAPATVGATARFDRATARSGGRFIRAARSSWKAAVKSWRRYAPFAGAYIVVARKELYTVTPIRPVWKPRRRLVGSLVNPSARNIT
ncbi:MAG: class I SAM-dependent methyltransferase [Gammaproteobacteria bacterium]